MGITITYFGHSCFVLTSNGYSIAVDPYDTHVPGYEPLDLKANKVLCSHEHADHNYTKAVEIVPASTSNPFTVTSYEIPHDEDGGEKRGMNRIRLFEAGGVRVAHFGDTGCDLTPDQQERLAGLDAIMVPVGGFYTIDAAKALEFLKLLKPRVFIPMHFRRGDFGLEPIADISVFKSLCPEAVEHDSDSIEITSGMTERVIILKYEGGSNK